MTPFIPAVLIAGERLDKDHPRLEALGQLDELNVFVGAVRTGLGTDATVPAALRDALEAELRSIQERLVDLVGAIAQRSTATVPTSAQRAELERSLSAMERELSPAARPILPGGVPTTARLHMCRAICDRAERSVVALARREAIAEPLLEYVGRLSAWFLAAARVVAAGTEKEWLYT
jgi:cob(I)alamin adenosyltransferase